MLWEILYIFVYEFCSGAALLCPCHVSRRDEYLLVSSQLNLFDLMAVDE